MCCVEHFPKLFLFMTSAHRNLVQFLCFLLQQDQTWKYHMGLVSPAVEYLPSACIFSKIRPAFNTIEYALFKHLDTIN